EATETVAYVIRFHLHPLVVPSLQQDGETVVLRLASGATWRFRAVGAGVSLEESVYLGGDAPRSSQQIVLTGAKDGVPVVKWALSKFG
ncbi:MAG: heparinase, partial [Alphaproteobacteria bacterium]